MAMRKKTLKYFTYLIFFLVLISCVISISNNAIYEDGEWANAQWLGQDIVTLFLAAPLLLISYFKGVKGNNSRWELVFSGILMYHAYSYAFYMFAAKLTFLYLFHAPVFGLSLIGLIISLIRVFSSPSEYSVSQPRIPWLVAGYLLSISLILAFLWSSDIISHLRNPMHTSDTPNGEAPLIIYSLDLALIVPLMIASALLLLRKNRSGYVLSGIMLIKTSILGFGLMAMAASLYLQELNPESFLVFLWCIIGLIGSMLCFLYLKNLNAKTEN